LFRSLHGRISRPKAIYSDYPSVSLIQEMGSGHLQERLHIEGEDEVCKLAKAMNGFADNLQNVVVATLHKIAQGDITVEVTPKDGNDEITPAIKGIIDSLRGLISETDILIHSAKNGQLGRRGDASRFNGSYRSLVEGINDTLDAITHPINEAAEVLEKIAARDLTARVVGEYKGDHAKIKHALNTTVQNLDDALSRVAQASEQVTSASGHISSGSQTLSQGSSEQASSLEEVSSSLQEITAMAKQNNINSKEAWNLAKAAETSVESGVDSMNRLSEAISRIKASSDSTAKIIKSIDDIAFQTNLLALNAAVEAARAGDAGKGFAVVAEEVRNLAMRSAAAAKDTASLIDESVKNSDGGVLYNQEVLRRLNEIDGQVKKVGTVMAEIASATEQQRLGVDQVTNVISQMIQVTQQVAANAEDGFGKRRGRAVESSRRNAQHGQDYKFFAQLLKVNPVTGALIDPHFRYSFSHRFHITRKAKLQSVDSRLNASGCFAVSQSFQPSIEDAGFANFDHTEMYPMGYTQTRGSL
jgi:methyl-accepting chemotaxis protein